MVSIRFEVKPISEESYIYPLISDLYEIILYEENGKYRSKDLPIEIILVTEKIPYMRVKIISVRALYNISPKNNLTISDEIEDIISNAFAKCLGLIERQYLAVFGINFRGYYNCPIRQILESILVKRDQYNKYSWRGFTISVENSYITIFAREYYIHRKDLIITGRNVIHRYDVTGDFNRAIMRLKEEDFSSAFPIPIKRMKSARKI
jgi:hypothetical protein